MGYGLWAMGCGLWAMGQAQACHSERSEESIDESPERSFATLRMTCTSVRSQWPIANSQ
jgi:hypothetical protein